MNLPDFDIFDRFWLSEGIKYIYQRMLWNFIDYRSFLGREDTNQHLCSPTIERIELQPNCVPNRILLMYLRASL